MKSRLTVPKILLTKVGNLCPRFIDTVKNWSCSHHGKHGSASLLWGLEVKPPSRAEGQSPLCGVGSEAICSSTHPENSLKPFHAYIAHFTYFWPFAATSTPPKLIIDIMSRNCRQHTKRCSRLHYRSLVLLLLLVHKAETIWVSIKCILVQYVGVKLITVFMLKALSPVSPFHSSWGHFPQYPYFAYPTGIAPVPHFVHPRGGSLARVPPYDYIYS